VDITITSAEGKASKIRDIDIFGNGLLTETQLRRGWVSNTSNWLSWYRRVDQYSREQLSGDLEELTNYYLDRGYVDFNIESTQVAISPDRRDMFVTANVVEGEVYTVSDVRISGDTVLPQEDVEKLLMIAEGDTFSRARVQITTDSITVTLST